MCRQVPRHGLVCRAKGFTNTQRSHDVYFYVPGFRLLFRGFGFRKHVPQASAARGFARDRSGECMRVWLLGSH